MDPAQGGPTWSFAGRMVSSRCSVVTLNRCGHTSSRGLFHHCSICTCVKARRLGVCPAGAAEASAYPRSAGADRLPAPGGPRPGDAPEHRQPQRRDDERSVPAAGQTRCLAVAGQTACRYGTNDSLKLLRQSYRAHRLMDGQLRIAADPLHQHLLAGMTSVQAVPPRVRLSNDWARLVEQAVLDGAPSCLGNSHPPGAIRGPCWPIGLRAGLGSRRSHLENWRSSW